jgi:uncharacterized RDD family membrane protein YckC
MVKLRYQEDANETWKMVGIFFLSSVLFLTSFWYFGLTLVGIGLGIALRQEKIFQSYPGDSKITYGGFWIRLCSLLIDSAFSFIVFIPLFFAANKIFFMQSINTLSMTLVLLVELYMMKRWGQSPGKMIMGLKVVKTDFKDIGWKEILLRYFFQTLNIFFIGFQAYVVYALVKQAGAQPLLPTDFVNLISDKFQNFFKIWTFSEMLVLLTNQRRRSLHDFMAGTVVIVDREPLPYFWVTIPAYLAALGLVAWFFIFSSDIFFRASAEQGDPQSEGMLGAYYLAGFGGHTKDYAQAMEWFKKGAAQGDGQSEFRLGEMYEKGKGVIPDYNEAIKWFQLATNSPKYGSKAQAELNWCRTELNQPK